MLVFTFLQIKITLPGGDATSIHLGNAVCVLGALLLGGVCGGLGGAIGMTIGDLLDPVYVIYAPKTFLLEILYRHDHRLIAHKVGHITHTGAAPYFCAGLSCPAALIFRPGQPSVLLPTCAGMYSVRCRIFFHAILMLSTGCLI